MVRQSGQQDTSSLQDQAKALQQQLEALGRREVGLLEERDDTLRRLGNVVHDSVPVSNNEVSRQV